MFLQPSSSSWQSLLLQKRASSWCIRPSMPDFWTPIWLLSPSCCEQFLLDTATLQSTNCEPRSWRSSISECSLPLLKLCTPSLRVHTLLRGFGNGTSSHTDTLRRIEPSYTAYLCISGDPHFPTWCETPLNEGF